MNNQQESYKIPKNKAEVILREAISIAKSIRVDQLDCNVSWCREDTNKTIEEVLQVGLKDKNTFYNFIIRHPTDNLPGRTDIGLSTEVGTGITYFLWINVNIDKAYKLVKKYKLILFG